jgi:hypothetical protein
VKDSVRILDKRLHGDIPCPAHTAATPEEAEQERWNKALLERRILAEQTRVQAVLCPKEASGD